MNYDDCLCTFLEDELLDNCSNVIVDDKRWIEEFGSLDKIFNEILCEVVKFVGFFPKVSVNFLLTNNDEIKILNNLYRKIDAPTDVISFPLLPERLLLDIWNSSFVCVNIGDIAFSYEMLGNKELINRRNRLIHLCIHSILHLLGYTHNNDDDYMIMESIESEILNKYHIFDVCK